MNTLARSVLVACLGSFLGCATHDHPAYHDDHDAYYHRTVPASYAAPDEDEVEWTYYPDQDVYWSPTRDYWWYSHEGEWFGARARPTWVVIDHGTRFHTFRSGPRPWLHRREHERWRHEERGEPIRHRGPMPGEPGPGPAPHHSRPPSLPPGR